MLIAVVVVLCLWTAVVGSGFVAVVIAVVIIVAAVGVVFLCVFVAVAAAVCILVGLLSVVAIVVVAVTGQCQPVSYVINQIRSKDGWRP